MKALDTTVAVDYLRGHPPATELLEGILGSGEPLVASEAVRFELLAGVREHERQGLESFFEAIGWAPIDEAVTRTGGELARQHRQGSSGIDDVDYLIAATTLVLQAPLLTTNVRHFPMLQGLEPAYG